MDDGVAKNERLSGHIIRAYENLKRLGQANITRGVIEAKLTILDDKWSAFLETHDVLERLATAEDLKRPYFVADVYAATEDGYALSKGKFLDLLRQDKGDEQPAARPATPATPQLPKISLPKFSGEFTDWPSFRDLFTSMVGNNSALTPIEKMHYLKMSLLKEPAALLASIPLTADNLAQAWKTLTDRYENVRLLTTSQISTICALPPMKLESSAELKRIFNGTVNAVAALRALGRTVDGIGDDFLVYLTAQKLDKQSRREWETSIGATKIPSTFAQLQTFLETRICSLEALEPPPCVSTPAAKATPAPAGPSKGSSSNKNIRSHQASSSSSSSKKCSLCKGDHYIVSCDAFRSKSAEDRRSFVMANRLCLNCLGTHFVRECRSQKTCQSCKAKHHSLIHDASAPSGRPASSDTLGAPGSALATPPAPDHPGTSQDGGVTALTVQSDASRAPSRVLLATAIVNVLTAGGTLLAVRAMIDQGSEASFVAESLVQRSRLPRSSASVSITGIGAKFATRARGRVTLTVGSRVDSRFELEVDALVLPKLCAYSPPHGLAGVDWPHLDGLALADPDSTSNLRIELILGADVFAQLLLPGVQLGPPDAPVAQNTRLGWVLSGRVVLPSGVKPSLSSLQLSVDQSLSSSLQRFWEQEEPEPSVPVSPDDIRCEEHFVSTHSRDASGRYIVRLPLKESIATLGDSLAPAARMLERMEHRARRDTKFGKAYSDFMTEYEALGHMEKVTPESSEPRLVYYFPHHGVIRESSETTKFRVVFNGSQKTSRGVSLNDCLLVGPKLLPELFDVMLRWRTHAIVFSADMEKMYRQVLLHPLDRDLQRVLWSRDACGKPSAYRLLTVTYGLACAPYLAIRVVRQLALDERERFPLGADALLTDVYVDDVLSGSDDVTSALAKQLELINLLKAGGFALRKWTSNAPDLLAHLPPSVLAAGEHFVVPSESAFHMLGLSWQATSDCFVFKLKTLESTIPLTKRKVLSRMAELFDPLGWLAPVIVAAKIFMQSLWLLKLDWDQPLPNAESREWLEFYRDLASISDVRIPRWLRLRESSRNLELHGFADASERAYAAVVYLCSTNDARSVSLVAAKTKVAPVKQVSLPRLELCAAHLLTSLTKRVRDVLSIGCSVHLWSDSTVTLAWIRGHPVRWKTYVANRVSEIQRTLPDAVWHHVQSAQNPADCASRGIPASELLGHPLWWTGPPWLLAPQEDWPTSSSPDVSDPPETRTASHISSRSPDAPAELMTRYSSLLRLQRIVAWCRRFSRNCKIHNTGSSTESRQLLSTLLPSELSSALTCLVKVEQARLFPKEILALKARSPVPRGPLLRLNPFLDDNGQLRLGGRLKHALLDADERHPIIVPRDSALTPLLIDHAHRLTLHGGTQLTLATLRQRFWILSGRSAVKTHIGRCVRCLRHRAVRATQLMGDLPPDRVNRARPFLHSGVDYAGPIYLRTSKGRGHKATKAYIAVFVCFATRAVHLEAVSDCSTEGFLAAYKRVTSRRGLCSTISSDCGTNFVGADSELRALFASSSAASDKIRVALANDGVEWKFNPPAAPHFGGLWEAAVKSVKHHLRRVVGDATLTFEEMSTLLSQIEACLNSRPLRALTDDPDDLDALTPGHLLIGAPLSAVPEPDLTPLPLSRLSRWQLVQQMRDNFWRRWSSEYLHQLQLRPKWHKPQPPLEIGDLVLMTSELMPPTKWPLARVIAVHPGQDGHTRVATVRTSASTFKRPVVKLCLLFKGTKSEGTI